MKAGRKQIFSEINITPLTDVFLVLLITMMVVAPMLDTSGLKLNMPTMAHSEDIKDEPKAIKLAIDATGSYSIDGESVNRLTLSDRLRTLKATLPEGVIIQTHPEATHEVLTYAMDAAQTAGISQVAVTAEGADEQ